MQPANGDTLHVHSTRVLVDGELVAATVRLEVAEPGVVARSIEPGPPPTGSVVEDLGDALVVPAPLDLHLHGAGGHAVPPGGRADDVGAILARASADAGWGASGSPAYEWLATLPIPQRPPADPVEHLAAAATDIAGSPASGCVGLRIEGLFLNPARAGVWPPDTFRAPDPELLAELHAAARDAGSSLRIIDVAPELDGAIGLIERARELGIVVSLAHSDATWEQAGRAIDAGPLASARALEGMTAVIVNVNKRYKAHAGLRLTGLK